MTQKPDPYWRMRPAGPTPADEICSCPDDPPVVLQEHLSEVPLACLWCNGEVPLERLGFSEELAERISLWRSLEAALAALWLDSGEYEQWAQAQLENPRGAVNVRGREIVRELNDFRRAYYWWFVDTPSGDCEPLTACPLCGRELTWAYGSTVCDPCSVVVPRRPPQIERLLNEQG